jgi:MipA family protein
MSTSKVLITCLALASTPIFAQSGAEAPETNETRGNWSGFIAVGGGIAPEFEGAGANTFIPYISADLKYRNVTLEFRGLGARLDILSAFGSGAIYGGPAFEYKLQRDNKLGKVGDPVRSLDKIAAQAFGGGFIGVKLGGDENGQGQFRVETTGVASSKGFEATGLVSYALVRNESFFVDVDSSLTYANGKYMRTYFGVTPAEALRSGLLAYKPGSGLKDFGTGLTVGYNFSSRWGVVANGTYSYLTGDAGKSPIVKGRLTGVKAEGSRSQFVGGLAISYRF